MPEQVQTVNDYLGSWGPQPDDHYAPPCAVEASEILTRDDWRELAVRWADWALEEIAAGHAEMAAERARGAYRFCLWFQQANGRPWEGGI